jgi:hypothetical protein
MLKEIVLMVSYWKSNSHLSGNWKYLKSENPLDVNSSIYVGVIFSMSLILSVYLPTYPLTHFLYLTLLTVPRNPYCYTDRKGHEKQVKKKRETDLD